MHFYPQALEKFFPNNKFVFIAHKCSDGMLKTKETWSKLKNSKCHN